MHICVCKIDPWWSLWDHLEIFCKMLVYRKMGSYSLALLVLKFWYYTYCAWNNYLSLTMIFSRRLAFFFSMKLCFYQKACFFLWLRYYFAKLFWYLIAILIIWFDPSTSFFTLLIEQNPNEDKAHLLHPIG